MSAIVWDVAMNRFTVALIWDNVSKLTDVCFVVCQVIPRTELLCDAATLISPSIRCFVINCTVYLHGALTAIQLDLFLHSRSLCAPLSSTSLAGHNVRL